MICGGVEQAISQHFTARVAPARCADEAGVNAAVDDVDGQELGSQHDLG
jgi:hypothetical protein